MEHGSCSVITNLKNKRLPVNTKRYMLFNHFSIVSEITCTIHLLNIEYAMIIQSRCYGEQSCDLVVKYNKIVILLSTYYQQVSFSKKKLREIIKEISNGGAGYTHFLVFIFEIGHLR